MKYLQALAVCLISIPLLQACPFCTSQRGPTLLGDFDQATMVLVGKFTNAKLDTSGGFEGGTTDFVIQKVLKDHKILGKNPKKITVSRYLPNIKNKFVIFCDVYKGLIDPYRGVELERNSDLVEYLQGMLKIRNKYPEDEKKAIKARLRYCFDYLNSPDYEVAIDAYREYAKADYKDYQKMAANLPADKIAGWLKNEKTPAYRYGLYSSLLGHCGTERHAELLKEMINDPKKRRSSGIDGMLAGYIMLLDKAGKKMEGLEFLKSILSDEEESFLMRYAVLRTARFFWTTRPDVFSKKDLVQTVATTLDQSDMADFAIEDLRKWKRWEMTDRVLALFNKKSHQVPIVKRAILRFALQSPKDSAKKFVDQQKKRDPEWVDETQQLLELEISRDFRSSSSQMVCRLEIPKS